MKIIEKCIYVTIIAALIVIITSGATYAYMKKNSEPIIKEKIITKEEINAKYIIGKDNKKYYLKLDESKEELLIYNDNLDIVETNIELYNCFDTVKYQGFLYKYNFGYAILEDNSIWYDNTLDLKITEEDIDTYKNYGYNKVPLSLKIKDNKIYFLMPKLNLTEDLGINADPGVLEEREYTINNNKLEYKVINTYKIKSISGNC